MAGSTTPSPQVRLTHETTVSSDLLHSWFLAVTLTLTALPGPLHLKVESLAVAGKKPPTPELAESTTDQAYVMTSAALSRSCAAANTLMSLPTLADPGSATA